MDEIILATILTYGFAGLASIAAIGFVVSRHPVYAALSFAVTVLASAGLYLLQGAPYAAAATVVVYAGATIIIFLFVLMFAQSSRLQIYDSQKTNFFHSFVSVILFVCLLHYAISGFSKTLPVDTGTEIAAVDTADSARGKVTPTVSNLGRVMYTQYLWAIELAGAILLVATVGAIHLAHDPDESDQLTASRMS